MAISKATLRRIRDHLQRDPALAVQFRVGPQQALGMLPYLTASERNELSQHASTLLARIGVSQNDPKFATGPLDSVSAEALQQLRERIVADPDFAAQLRVGRDQALVKLSFLGASERETLCRVAGDIENALIVRNLPSPLPPDPTKQPFYPQLPIARADISWEQAGPLALLHDADAFAWHTGRVDAAITTGSGLFLVAASTGGVWLVDFDGGAQCLSNDWPVPNTRTMVRGPLHPEHVFVGGLCGLYESAISATLPLSKPWRRIFPNNASARVSSATSVNAVIVVPRANIVVIATEVDVLWAPIPAASFGADDLYSRSDAFNWTLGIGLPTPASGVFGLAAGAHGVLGSQATIETVVATPVSPGGQIFVAQLLPGTQTLAFAISYNGPPNDQQQGVISLAACAGSPNFVYAAVAGRGKAVKSTLVTIQRSFDGGLNWSPTGMRLNGGSDIIAAAAGQGDDASSAPNVNNCLAVSPNAPSRLALGWQSGPFLSTDSGDNWTWHGDENPEQGRSGKLGTPHLHADVRGLRFLSDDSLLACTDGGLALTNDFGATWNTRCNIRLLVTQFYQIDVSTAVPGRVVGGFQDNGTQVAHLSSTDPSWRQIAGSDGQTLALLAGDSALVWSNLNDTFQGAHSFPAPPWFFAGLYAPWGLDIDQPYDPWFNKILSVRAPSATNSFGQRMFAVTYGRYQIPPTSSTSTQYVIGGIFADEDGGNRRWQKILFYDPVTNYPISAIASNDGQRVFILTQLGYIYSFEPFGTQVQDHPIRFVPPGTWPPEAVSGQMIMVRPDYGFCTYNTATRGNFLLRHNVFTGGSSDSWIPVAGLGLPNSAPFVSVEAIGDGRVFVATASGVWASDDDGRHWRDAKGGQPNAAGALPLGSQCGDLRWNFEVDGTSRLFLSTFGRGLWVATVPPKSR